MEILTYSGGIAMVTTRKMLSDVDVSDSKNRQMYENLMRVRLKRFAYRFQKRKTGYRIIDDVTGAPVSSDGYTLTFQEVEEFWKQKYDEQCEQKQQKQFEKWLKANKATMWNGWIVTDDSRSIKALEEHVAKFGDFDADGNGAGGDIFSTMYRAYRPWCCPEFTGTWTKDGDSHNLTDWNLGSNADETNLPDGVVPITKQRRIWHNQHRIFIKLPDREKVFFTNYDPILFQLLCNRDVLSGWYIQEQERKTKAPQYRLYCRVAGKITSLAELVVLFFEKRIDTANAVASIIAGKQWMRENNLQVDHLRDNRSNNCIHNLCIVPATQNGSKSDLVTAINAPYFFVPVQIDGRVQVLCGRGDSEAYNAAILCDDSSEFLACIKQFSTWAKGFGDMLQTPSTPDKTACVSEMLQDDGELYHNGQINPIEWLLRADESELTPWNGHLPWLTPRKDVAI